MRIKLSSDGLEKINVRLKTKNYSNEFLARKFEVSNRTIYEWLRGKYTIPDLCFLTLLECADITTKDIDHEVVEDHWNTSVAGKIAGIKFKQSGRKLSTSESQRNGGLASYNSRRNNRLDIFSRIEIKRPELSSPDLSEFIGIMIGDGSISAYQITISSNTSDDSDYIRFLKPFIEDLFGIRVTQKARNERNCTVTTVSSIELVGFLTSLGLPRGDKIKNKVDIPGWIKEDPMLAQACLRGVFDTDGCVYFEKHSYKKKQYSYPRISFVNASEPLLESIYSLLKELGYSPKRRHKKVNLEQFTDIVRYFTIVGSSNLKHITRFTSRGEVG